MLLPRARHPLVWRVRTRKAQTSASEQAVQSPGRFVVTLAGRAHLGGMPRAVRRLQYPQRDTGTSLGCRGSAQECYVPLALSFDIYPNTLVTASRTASDDTSA